MHNQQGTGSRPAPVDRVDDVAERAGQPDLVLHDGAYDFNEQLVYPMDAVRFAAGDRLRVECTFENDGDSIIGFGESSNNEMCFAVVARYPATNQSASIL